jgi:hypothetical protein
MLQTWLSGPREAGRLNKTSDSTSDQVLQVVQRMLSQPSDSVVSETNLANKKANNWISGRTIESHAISGSKNHTPIDLHICDNLGLAETS